MRIATFNINNINKRLENLVQWLDETKPDVVCLQELKAEQKAFPLEAIEAEGAADLERRGDLGARCPAGDDARPAAGRQD
jgi:exonuclease III